MFFFFVSPETVSYPYGSSRKFKDMNCSGTFVRRLNRTLCLYIKISRRNTAFCPRSFYKNSASQCCFTSDVMYKKFKRLVYTLPQHFHKGLSCEKVNLCKPQVSDQKNSEYLRRMERLSIIFSRFSNFRNFWTIFALLNSYQFYIAPELAATFACFIYFQEKFRL